MKKVFFSLLASLTFLFIPSFAHAEDAVKSPRPFMQKVQNVKQEIKERSATKESERKEKMTELRRTIAKNFFETMIKRFEAAQERLNKILARIESRVAKIKSENPTKDLTQVNVEISSVKTSLAKIDTEIAILKNDFDATLTSETPRENYKQVTSKTSTIKKELESVKRMLSKIVGDIKGLRIGESKNE